jgi:hypothetical protein
MSRLLLWNTGLPCSPFDEAAILEMDEDDECDTGALPFREEYRDQVFASGIAEIEHEMSKGGGMLGEEGHVTEFLQLKDAEARRRAFVKRCMVRYADRLSAITTESRITVAMKWMVDVTADVAFVGQALRTHSRVPSGVPEVDALIVDIQLLWRIDGPREPITGLFGRLLRLYEEVKNAY